MPIAIPPSKVLVSGANGFIAIWIVRTLLERGYAVRAAVRSESKGAHLQKLFKDEVSKGVFELAIVHDMIEPGAFDKAVKGVDAIEHTASPVSLSADDPDEIIIPAVRGTIGILESALKYAGPQLKRVVITSSSASMNSESSTGLLDESIWSDAVSIVREKGRETSQMNKYRASKTLAEKSAWDFVSTHKSSLTWDLVTLLPVYVFGPVIHEVSTPSTLNLSTAAFYNSLFSSNRPLAEVQGSWVDVRDVAEAHVRSLELPEASGQRILLANEPWVWQDWLNTVGKIDIPGFSISTDTTEGKKESQYKVRYDNTKARIVLGLKFRDKLTTAKDMIEDFQAPPAKVLVSGANGFIATWVARTLLERGYTVRGAIRSENKGSHLLNLFRDEATSGRLELVVVPDMTIPGAFNEAVKGVDAIEHTASPVSHDTEDPNEQIEPAVKGTIGILESAIKHAGPQLKRIVVTSSCAAIAGQTAIGALDETIWNESSIYEVREKGFGAAKANKYRASKTLAEKAAWDFVSAQNSNISWDLVTLCPPLVFGPVIHDVSTPSTLNHSVRVFYDGLFSEIKPPANAIFFGVDVRDVAEGRVRALQIPEAGGQRFILANEPSVWQDWLDAANSLKPEIPGLSIDVGTPESGKGFQYKAYFNSEKARNILGMDFHRKSDTARDMILDFKTRGWKIVSSVISK